MPRKRSRAASLLILLLTSVGLISILAACCPAQKYANRIARGTVLPLPPRGDVRGADLLVTNWDPNLGAETVFVTYVAMDGKKHKVLWEKELAQCDDCWGNSYALFDESRVYYLAGDRLLALDQQDGTTIWATSSSDLISTACEQCIWESKGYIIALTMDYVLQGINAENGNLAWSVRLNNPSAAYDGFSVVGDQVMLVDWADVGVSDRILRVFDPASGSLLREIAPTCPDTKVPAWFNEVFIERTSGGRAIFTYGCRSEPFIQSWGLADGEEMWQAPLPEEARASLDSFLLGHDTLYLNTHDGHFGISLSSGQAEQMADLDPDYAVTILAEHDGGLVAKVERTRGSTRYELWGLDTSGRRLWQYEMQAGTLLDVDSGSADWAYHFTPDGLIVIQVLREPEEHISAAMLDPQDGQVIQESELAIDVSSLDGVAWDSTYAYVTVWGDIYTVDLQTLDIKRVWP
jgi:hypothetical protein